jgi:hypothetical protein
MGGGAPPPDGPPPDPPGGPPPGLLLKKFCANLDGADVLASVRAAAAVVTVLVIAELCILPGLK